MFSNGAIKPLLNVSDGDVTNEACMLAGLGCIVQLCRYLEVLFYVYYGRFYMTSLCIVFFVPPEFLRLQFE